MTEQKLMPGWAHGIGKFLAHGVWNTRVLGAELVPETGPVVLAANHVSVIDGPLLAGASPRRLNILVKEEMFHGPIGAILRASGQIPVDRDGGGRSALVAGLNVLQRGGAVGVFPEGNRGRGDAASARAGVSWLAVNGDAPVVPVAVLGTRRTGEGVNHIPGVRRRLWVRFGEPIMPVREPGASKREAVSATNEAVRVALSGLVARTLSEVGVGLPED
ncbi:lysophospholipid acyltransferase family protein [Cellulomonas sp. NPDC089187]|uniref:lysophospholipid acyltransferase family protein n=1 Tax=Cellulomonas sp. NPDC089187 TaxID=3154970 RepID=UPI00341C7D6E